MLACPCTTDIQTRIQCILCVDTCIRSQPSLQKYRFTRIDHCSVAGIPRGLSDAIITIAHLRTAPARSCSVVGTTEHPICQRMSCAASTRLLPVLSPKWLAYRLSNASCSQLPQPLKEMTGAPPLIARGLLNSRRLRHRLHDPFEPARVEMRASGGRGRAKSTACRPPTLPLVPGR